MTNWLHHPKDDKESNWVALFVEKSKEETNLCSDDIIQLFLSRRVLPLQRRAHKMSQMSGQRDPTRITTHSLSPTYLVLKAKQICRNTLRPNRKSDLKPYSRSDPPPPKNFSRIAREGPASFTPSRRFHDDVDADTYVKGKHKMGPTHFKRPAPPSADENPQVHEHVAPLAAKVGQEFLDALAQGQAPRPRKNKAPALDAGTSEVPPTKRHKKKGSSGPPGRKRGHEMPGSPGPYQECTRYEAGSIRRCCQDLSSSRKSDFEDTGASNMGAGSEDVGRTEPPVPPVLKKKKKATAASPSKLVPETSMPATSSPAKDAPGPPPAPSASEPASAPQPTPAEGATVTAHQLGAAVTAVTAPPSGSQAQSMVLHVSRAAVAAGDKASAQLGRIVELTRGEVDPGSLREYAEKWNRVDLSPPLAA
nr:actin cytoskeleton-regulatory complex protein pan-1-like [Lolium perenne]